MTVRNPLYFDGTDLVEMTANQLTGLKKRARFTYSLNPSVRLANFIDPTGGSNVGLIQMDNTNRIAGPYSLSSSAYPAGTPTSVNTDTYNRIGIDSSQHSLATIDKLVDSNDIGFPLYYDGSGNLRAMTDSDFIDTFIAPALNDYDGVTSTGDNDLPGLYHISSSATDSDGVNIAGPLFRGRTGNPLYPDSGSTNGLNIIFSDEVPDVSLYTAGGIPEALEQNLTAVNYYLYYGTSSGTFTEPYNPPAMAYNTSGDIYSADSAYFDRKLQDGMRWAALHQSGRILTYELQDSAAGPGAARGTAILDQDVASDGTGEVRRLRKLNSNDYRAQYHPTGATVTVNTYQLRLLLK